MVRRYILLQIPGLLAALIGLGALHFWFGVSLEVTLIALAVWVAKDVALYPFVKHAYDPQVPSPHDRLLGRCVTADNGLGASGYVRLDGELWRAQLAEGSDPIEPGKRAQVVRVSGLTLYVRSEVVEAEHRRTP